LLREHEEGNLDPSPLPVNSLEKLGRLNAKQLSRVYGSCTVGEIPTGDSDGQAILMPGTIVGKILSAVANLLWKGKVFTNRAAGVGVINKILGMHLVKAQVFSGASWKDDGAATIIDYKRTSWLAFFVRDEIRQVLPDLYLGKMYVRLPFGHHVALAYFALDFQK
jgi:hypothetical protein